MTHPREYALNQAKREELWQECTQILWQPSSTDMVVTAVCVDKKQVIQTNVRRSSTQEDVSLPVQVVRGFTASASDSEACDHGGRIRVVVDHV